MTKSRIIVFITTIQFVLFLGHYLVYRTTVDFFNLSDPTCLLWTRVIFLILSLCFLLASVLNYRFYGIIGRVIYRAAAIWMGTLLWLFLASILSSILYIAGLLFIPPAITAMLAQLLLVLALIISIYGLYNSHKTRVKRITVNLPNLPATWRGKKAVMFADSHLGSYWNINFAKKLAEMIDIEKPDIVFISGDFYDGPPADLEQLALPFKNITAPYGIYFCAGNHEEFGDPSPFFVALKKAGVKVLDNQIVTVDGLQILGIGFGVGTKAEKEKEILSSFNINKNLPSILLKHEPSRIDLAESFGISLQLSGHTHFGQTFPLNFITKKVYGKFHTGLNTLNTTQVYTTTGAGAWGPPQRVGNHPEIVVINLQ